MNYKHLIRVAQGLEPADLVLKNAEVFHVFTGEFIRCDVAIAEGHIAGTGSYFGIEEIDMEGKYLTPGFIDAHVHIESSMLTPAQFAKAALPCGTTTVVTDPHEIANVYGAKGIQYMLDSSEGIPLNTYIMLPSCVPSTDWEDAGASLSAEDLEPFLANPRVLGLAEVMDTEGVLTQSPKVSAKLQMAAGYCIDGHAPGLTCSQIMGYAAAGVRSDHECVNKEQALDRLRAGMYVMLRDGTAAKSLKALLPAVNPDTAPYFMFCVDDKLPAEMLEKGYINNMVRKTIRAGVSVANALQIATINAARYFGLKDVGALAPGCKADILVFEDLHTWRPVAVYKDGRKVVDKGRLLIPSKQQPFAAHENSVRLSEVSLGDFAIPLRTEAANVICLVPYQIVTKRLQLKVKKESGCAVSDVENDVLKMLVFERHHATGKIGKGLVKGFGLRRGALASTIAHDAHNLAVIGTNDEDMLLAVQELQRIGGGICITDGGKVIGSLALPIAGLMTDESAEVVAETQEQLIQIAREMGVPEFYAPFLTLAFLSLPVVPAVKLTDRGMVDVANNCLLPLEASF